MPTDPGNCKGDMAISNRDCCNSLNPVTLPHSVGGSSVTSVASLVLAPVTLLYKCCNKCVPVTAEGAGANEGDENEALVRAKNVEIVVSNRVWSRLYYGRCCYVEYCIGGCTLLPEEM